MTCINCPIEVSEARLDAYGLHVRFTYEGIRFNHYYPWKFKPGTELGFYTYLRLLSRIAREALASYRWVRQ